MLDLGHQDFPARTRGHGAAYLDSQFEIAVTIADLELRQNRVVPCLLGGVDGDPIAVGR